MRPSQGEVYEVSDALQKMAIATNRVGNSLCWNSGMRRKVDRIHKIIMDLREELAKVAK